MDCTISLDRRIALRSCSEISVLARTLEGQWESYINSKTGAHKKGPLRQVVLGSWERCRSFGLDAILSKGRKALSAGQVREIFASSWVLRLAEETRKGLEQMLKGTGHIVALCDNKGHIIEVGGDRAVHERAEKEIGFFQGADWAESSAGTNAIGTALEEKDGLQVFAGEHFGLPCHAWSCSASPILPQGVQEPVGLLDITGPYELAQPHTLALIEASVNIVNAKIERFLEPWVAVLKSLYEEALRRYLHDGVVILDALGRVVAFNEKASHLLKAAYGRLDAPKISLLESISRLNGLVGGFGEASLGEGIHLTSERVEKDGLSIGWRILLYQKRAKAKRFRSLEALKEPLEPNPLAAWLGDSFQAERVRAMIKKASLLKIPVLLEGESGTGKEMLAWAVHELSPRSKGPLVTLNTAAMPGELLASELFGYGPGAFTGALKSGKPGKLEQAHTGTLFLDEIGDMPLSLQPYLLRVLEEGHVVRVGELVPRRVDVRVVAATNRDLSEDIRSGRFRSDLFYRLSSLIIAVPPLRERISDIPLLAVSLLRALKPELKLDFEPVLSDGALRLLKAYAWPGNVRELKNILTQALLQAESPVLEEGHFLSLVRPEMRPLEFAAPGVLPQDQALDETLRALLSNGGNVSGAARSLHVARSTVYRRLQRNQDTPACLEAPRLKG